MSVCRGKGRKEGVTQLTPGTAAALRVWLAERDGGPPDPLFPTSTGRRLTRDALERRLAKWVQIASRESPPIHEKRVTMHVLRHTAAIRLLQAGVDTSVIALWVGHASPPPPRSIWAPTSSSSNERSTARARPTASRDAIDHRTISWASCRTSDGSIIRGVCAPVPEPTTCSACGTV
jgi:integrase